MFHCVPRQQIPSTPEALPFMHVNLKTLWKKIFSFFRAIRQGLFFLAFVGMALMAYLYFHGLPSSWKQAVLNELERRGIHLQMESLHLDPLRGVVARGVKYTPSNEQISIHIGEIALNINIIHMLRKRFVLDEVEVDGCDIQLYPGVGKDSITIQRTAGSIRFAKDGVVYLESVVGDLSALRLEINGRLDLSVPAASPPHAGPRIRSKTVQDFTSKLKLLKAAEPVLVELRVDGKVAEPETLRVKAQIHGRSVSYDGWRTDLLSAQLNYANKVLSIPVLSIEAGGGKASLNGSYDTSSSSLQFELSSDLIPNALLSKSSDRQNLRFFSETRFRIRPEFWIKGEADLSAKNPWQTLNGDVVFRLREVLWRENLIRELQGNGKISRGCMEIPHLKLIQDFGQMEGSFGYEFTAQALTFDFNSTLNISSVMKILYPSQKNWFQTVQYRKPPVLKLAGQWLIQDPSGLKASGSIDWSDWSSRGIPIRSVQAGVKIDGRRFQFQKLKLVREEGEVAGDFVLDFQKQRAELGVISTVHFADLARFIGPKLEELLRPYQFPLPPRIRLDGIVSFEDNMGNDLVAHVEAPRFRVWKFLASNAVAEVRSHRCCLEIAKYTSDFHDGRLEGDAIFDLSRPEVDWSFHCHVDKADFDQLTHELWDYKEVQGRLTGWAEMSGVMKNSRETRGHGEAMITDGVLAKIPVFIGLLKWIPVLGEEKVKKATMVFTVQDETVNFSDIKITGGIVSLTAKGDYKFDKTLDFFVHKHYLRWFPLVSYPLDVVTKIFEFRLRGTIDKPKWSPRYIPVPQFDQDENPKDKGEKEKSKES